MPSREETPMEEACRLVGELILWTNLLDHQLNQVMVGVFALPMHPLIEPIVAQMDIRPKAELLKSRMKTIPAGISWTNGIVPWVNRVEKVNEYRNIVAHHRFDIVNEQVLLTTSQLSKHLKSIGSDMKPKPRKGVSDIKSWVATATAVCKDGMPLVEAALKNRLKAAGLPKEDARSAG